MKLILIISLLFTCLIFDSPTFAENDSELEHVKKLHKLHNACYATAYELTCLKNRIMKESRGWDGEDGQQIVESGGFSYNEEHNEVTLYWEIGKIKIPVSFIRKKNAYMFTGRAFFYVTQKEFNLLPKNIQEQFTKWKPFIKNN